MEHSKLASADRTEPLLGAPLRQVGSVLAVAALCACTELSPGGDRLPQVSQPVQPDAGISPAETRWGCLDEPIPTLAAPLMAMVELSLSVVDTVTGAPPAGLVARACARLDPTCDPPLSPEVSPDIDGAVHLFVPQGFSGFVELRSPSTVPTMYFVNRALMRNTAESFAVISPAAIAGLAAQDNVTLEPMTGLVLIRAFDCQRNLASGVQLSTNKGGAVYAFVDGLPLVGRDETTEEGLGGFINMPIGIAVIQGIVSEHGSPLGNASVIVREAWFSYGDVEPLPL